jgi:poly(3-hydroxyalkanoate) depolymerase
MSAAHQVHTVAVGRHRLRISVRPGTVPGPPLLICNGIGLALEVCQPFVDALDPRLEVVRFDALGVGGSSKPWFPYCLPQLARLIGRMLDRLGYDRYDVLGLSWGGALAQQLAFQNPRRCRRQVLVATATGPLMVPADLWALLQLATPRHRDPRTARRIAGEIYGGSVRSRPELAEQFGMYQDRPEFRRAYIYQLVAVAGWTSLPFLPLIRQDSLILAGDDDPLVPLANARIMGRLLPSARVHIYPDGHLGLVSRADEIAPVVSEFLLAPSQDRNRGGRLR